MGTFGLAATFAATPCSDHPLESAAYAVSHRRAAWQWTARRAGILASLGGVRNAAAESEASCNSHLEGT